MFKRKSCVRVVCLVPFMYFLSADFLSGSSSSWFYVIFVYRITCIFSLW